MIIGISKEYLESKINELYECADRGNDAINGLSAGANIAILKALLSECEELPPQQWQTIEEFKANPVEGWCWIFMQDKKLKHLHYRNDGFWISDNKDIVFYNHYFITHVMPIKTPEAPE